MQAVSLFGDISRFTPQKETKHQKFQVVGKEIQEYFNIKDFPIFIFLKYHPGKIDDAFFKAQKIKVPRTLDGFKYFVGIIKNLK